MRILIVDDEQPARDKLQRLLEQEDGVCALAQAADAVEALAMLESFKPDVAFLDIQMPEISGIELAASLPAPAPLIVFATAYDQFAIAAFDANAIDYLLKPYDRARLQRSLSRVRERLALRRPPPAFDAGQSLRQLLVSERGVTRIVTLDALEWIETADNYVILHTATVHPLLRQTLAGLLDRLGPRFVRCHRRAAVQLAQVARVEARDKGDCELVLRSGTRVPCSRQYSAAVLALLSG
ncbi:response regulator [Massilia sp. PAMC28688]|uniref:LytR/AlgR family response regulator transcription factor n=1 Tax=Massilia sp. PAMC28688 TaxID=2861283 RepID=UPI001C62D99F|nr:response regulator [Massilia sp. PAMC28688]QYF92417.1 response regulator [Massilia sp. PAMC28688]